MVFILVGCSEHVAHVRFIVDLFEAFFNIDSTSKFEVFFQKGINTYATDFDINTM